jgi:hypothetical protein
VAHPPIPRFPRLHSLSHPIGRITGFPDTSSPQLWINYFGIPEH